MTVKTIIKNCEDSICYELYNQGNSFGVSISAFGSCVRSGAFTAEKNIAEAVLLKLAEFNVTGISLLSVLQDMGF